MKYLPVIVALSIFGCTVENAQTPEQTPEGIDVGFPDVTEQPDSHVEPDIPPDQEEADLGPLDLGYETGERIVRTHCVACHTLGNGTYRATDLKDAHIRNQEQWLVRWLTDPVDMRSWNRRAQMISDEWPLLDMPNPVLDSTEITAVINFIATQSAQGPLIPRTPMALDAAQIEQASKLYFDRCAGCHGTYRNGATGPDIGELRSKELGTDTLAAVIWHGTPNGMPAWGATEVLTDREVEMLAAFLQLPPPEAPLLSFADIQATWRLPIPVADRPTAPVHQRNWENYFGVVSRDTGVVTVYDGDTYEALAVLDTGFAVHILRSSSSGRYFYAVGRDGRITMIDLWSEVPSIVAEARGCFDARSVESSKFEGYEDRYLVEGCYWPSQYVVFDGLTLEPLAKGDIGGATVDTNEVLVENRVAVIVASEHAPKWYLALKESGHVAVVDYSQPEFPLISRIPALRYLHDGGWDSTGRYFMVAANASNSVVIVDTHTDEQVANFETGNRPHPGRGANWEDPEFGRVGSTLHMGEGKLAVYGTDPELPNNAWKVVRSIPLPSAGSLFHKTHPNSPWVLADFPLAADSHRNKVCAYSKTEAEIDQCWEVSPKGPAVHFEFNQAGTEFWVSVWAADGELVIYDAVTLAEKRRITGVHTPTGKFNVFNTSGDIY